MEHLLHRSRGAGAARLWWQTVVRPCLLDPADEQHGTSPGVGQRKRLRVEETDPSCGWPEEGSVEIAERWANLEERMTDLDKQRTSIVSEAIEAFRSLGGFDEQDASRLKAYLRRSFRGPAEAAAADDMEDQQQIGTSA